MHSVVLEKEWQTMVEPIKSLSVAELRQLKAQYKHLKEIKSRHITDMQGVLGVFGLLATDQSRSNSPMGFTSTPADEMDGARESHVPMDVKFEEEPYEDEDWFLMLLSELIFNKLKLEKP
mmetsp:Transcript_33629/g.44407  ORF Transcript_33629/g.44407 Transcript_33629/m.44407 type:complete len:120 (+) Transcript_33629:219-578(+)